MCDSEKAASEEKTDKVAFYKIQKSTLYIFRD